MIKDFPGDMLKAGQLIKFYRSHLDIFIQDAFYPVKLTKTQRVLARAIGNNEDVKIVASRGYGKSFVVALSALALGCLYPGTLVAVCSGTAQQAAITLQKLKILADTNANIANQLTSGSARTLVQLSRDKGKASLKNGSIIESFSMDSIRGQRAKIVIEDEVALINQEDLNAVVAPLKNYKRPISFERGYKDFASKTISITSAVEKTNSFYSEFLRVAKKMPKPGSGCFAVALNYEAAIDDGITDASFFLKEKERMPQTTFAMEYDSKFLGAASGSAFPFQLTNPCRILEKIQLAQPKNSKSRYVISLDIATSNADTADNSIIAVIKFTERTDGTFLKRLVFMKSFHGKGLDTLAQEIRVLYHNRFPNCEKIIYDARGVGDAFDKFMDSEWTDVQTGREYPPLVTDDVRKLDPDAIPILHPVRAVQALNQRIATNLRIVLQKKTLELPINSRAIQAKKIDAQRTDQPMQLTQQEMAVYFEADALQMELGNVFARVSSSGNVLYDCKANQHKDRYSALAYNNDYICELEKENMRKHQRGPVCIGFSTKF